MTSEAIQNFINQYVDGKQPRKIDVVLTSGMNLQGYYYVKLEHDTVYIRNNQDVNLCCNLFGLGIEAIGGIHLMTMPGEA